MEHKWIIWLKACWSHVVGIGAGLAVFPLILWRYDVLDVEGITRGLGLLIPVVGIMLAHSYNTFAGKLEEQIDLTSEIGEKLTELDQVTATLRGLIDFVTQQKEMIRREEKAIQELSTEKEDLEPIVKQSRAVVDKIFELQAKRSRRHRIVSLIVGFFLGIASSAIATIVIQNAK